LLPEHRRVCVAASNMSANRAQPTKPKPGTRRDDSFPSDEELLHELRLHGAKPPPRKKDLIVSRRTRDYLLLAGMGSAVIAFGVFRLLGGSDSTNALTLAGTGIALFCGLLWFIFYGVMSRY
jgi:hypothetical protein